MPIGLPSYSLRQGHSLNLELNNCSSSVYEASEPRSSSSLSSYSTDITLTATSDFNEFGGRTELLATPFI